jgi:hypothetical protein
MLLLLGSLRKKHGEVAIGRWGSDGTRYDQDRIPAEVRE